MWVTWMPISSMWPTTARLGPAAVPGTRTTEEPTRSQRTSSEKAATRSRHTRAGAVSWPDGPAARSRASSSSGTGAVATGLVPEQLSQDELQDPAVAVVDLLLGRVDAHGHLELVVVGLDGQGARHLVGAGDADDRESFV